MDGARRGGRGDHKNTRSARASAGAGRRPGHLPARKNDFGASGPTRPPAIGTAKTTFYGLQELAMRSIAEGGEVLILRRWVMPDDNNPLPIQLQILEGAHSITLATVVTTWAIAASVFNSAKRGVCSATGFLTITPATATSSRRARQQIPPQGGCATCFRGIAARAGQRFADRCVGVHENERFLRLRGCPTGQAKRWPHALPPLCWGRKMTVERMAKKGSSAWSRASSSISRCRVGGVRQSAECVGL